MDEPALLREYEVAAAFRKAMRASDQAIIAVPFWGNGAVKTLGLNVGAPVRIICNLDHPGCNPWVIEKLLDLKIRVRTNRRLHAKIYATSDVAIVGSSNVSSNGLTAEGEEAKGWIEANVMSRDRNLVDAVGGLFETLWNDKPRTVTVTRAAIAAAKKAREALPPFVFDVPQGTPLFDAVLASPAAFASVYVAAYSTDLDDDADASLRATRKGALPAGSKLEASDFSKAEGYQFKGIPIGAWLINLDCRKPGAPRYRGCAKDSGLRIACDGPIALAIALPGKIRIGGRSFPLRTAEQERLCKAAAKIMRAANNKVLPLADAIKLMRR